MSSLVIASADKVVKYFQTNSAKFDPITQRTPYYHMGATITDAVLQAGLNYIHVVYPRVLTLLTQYSDYKSTCDFIILMQTVPLDELIHWRNLKKLTLVKTLAWFFHDNGIENEDQLSKWLDDPKHVYELQSYKGIGPKTLDYLSMLSGNQAIAVDRHLFKFLELMDIFTNSYQEANDIFSLAAIRLGFSKYEMDKKVWQYMVKSAAI